MATVVRSGINGFMANYVGMNIEHSCLAPPTMNSYIDNLSRLYIEQRHYLSGSLV